MIIIIRVRVNSISKNIRFNNTARAYTVRTCRKRDSHYCVQLMNYFNIDECELLIDSSVETVFHVGIRQVCSNYILYLFGIGSRLLFGNI